jgi:SNF2 family DNA or RNA helicase
MRAYQVDGFHFLAYLTTNSFGGILADDMGLGKTLQTLAWIAWMREQPDFDGKPVLVVCPKSVVQNWIAEAQRFLPSLRTLIWRGGDAQNLQRAVAKTDLVVINYAQLRISSEALTGRMWHAVVLDEAQYIKNPASQTAVTACTLQGKHRLALSGTPVENHLGELWALFDFLNPGMLGKAALFGVGAGGRSIDPEAKDLLARGFKFVGTTIIYAFMQATGMVNDHLITCACHARCAQLK